MEITLNRAYLSNARKNGSIARSGERRADMRPLDCDRRPLDIFYGHFRND